MDVPSSQDLKLYVNRPSFWLVRAVAWAVAAIACFAFATRFLASLFDRADWLSGWTTAVSHGAVTVGVWAVGAALLTIPAVQLVGRDAVPPAIEDEGL